MAPEVLMATTTRRLLHAAPVLMIAVLLSCCPPSLRIVSAGPRVNRVGPNVTEMK